MHAGLLDDADESELQYINELRDYIYFYGICLLQIQISFVVL